MDPKVCGKLLTHYQRGYGVDVEALHGRFPPPAECRRRLQDGISRIHKVAAVEIGFRGTPGCFRGIWAYIGELSRSLEPRGAHEGGGRAYPPRARPPALWPPRLLLDVHSNSLGLRLFQEDRPRRFHSVWTPFDIPFLRNTEIGK